jgi:hypothetical protein
LPGNDLKEYRIVSPSRNRNREARKARITFAIETAGVLSVLLLAAMVEVAALQHFDPDFQLAAAQLSTSFQAPPQTPSR